MEVILVYCSCRAGGTISLPERVVYNGLQFCSGVNVETDGELMGCLRAGCSQNHDLVGW